MGEILFQPAVWKSECAYTVQRQGVKGGSFSKDISYGEVTVTEERRSEAIPLLTEACLKLAREKYMSGELDIGQWFPKKKVGPDNVNPEKVKVVEVEVEGVLK